MPKKVHECNKQKGGECDAQKKVIMSSEDYDYYVEQAQRIDAMRIQYAMAMMNATRMLDVMNVMEDELEKFSMQLKNKYKVDGASFNVDSATREITVIK